MATLTGCGKGEGGNIPVTLNEVAHSIFYAPQYVAIEKGYFEEEGIDLTLVNGGGADKVMTAMLSGEADIGDKDKQRKNQTNVNPFEVSRCRTEFLYQADQ